MLAKSTSLSDILLYVVCAIIAILILVRDVGDVSFNKYILLAVCVIPMFLLNFSNAVCLLSFLFALTFGTPSNYIYAIAILALIQKKPVIKEMNKAFFLIFVVWMLLDNFVLGSSASMTNQIGFITRFFLLAFFIYENIGEINYEKAIALFAIGVIIMCFAILGYFLKTNDISSMINYGIRLGDASSYLDEGVEQGMKMNTNSNNVACYCMTALGCCINLFLKNRNPIWMCLYFVIFALGLLTVSRAFIIIGAILTITFVFSASKGKLPWYIKILFIGIVYFVIYYLLNSEFVAVFERRFNSESVVHDSREVIFEGYWTSFWSNPFVVIIGAGVFSHRDILYPAQACHNQLQQILVSFGIIGFVFFIYFLTNAFNKHRLVNGSNSEKYIAYCTLVSTLVYQQTIQFLAPVDLMLPMIVAFFALKNISYQYRY